MVLATWHITDGTALRWLDRLFPDLGGESFLADFWAHDCLVGSGELERLQPIPALPQLSNVKTTLEFVSRSANKQVRVRVWFQGEGGKHKLLTLRPEEASHLYETGAVTVVVDKIDLIIPELGFLLGQLSRELGTPTVYQCNLYCSPTGAGSVRHFDQQEVFFVQLSGRKQWRVSPNDQVAYPTGYYFGDHLVHPEVAAICSEFKSATADVRDYVLERGSVMFLPRGYWHESRTIEDSIALTLSIASLSWLDLYSSQIRKKLLQIEAWREPAVGLLGAEARRRVAAGKFRNLLDDLSVRLKSMDVRDFEPETEHTGLGRLQRSRYRTAPGFRLSSSRSGSRFLHAQGHRPIEVNDDIAQVIESMSSADEPFSALDIRILSPGVEIAGILVALERLLEAGFIDAT